MKIACNQPNYIPWYPFFHLIKSVDKFFLLDVVKPGKKNYIVRNKIFSDKKEIWLTIPSEKKDKYKNICNSFIGEKFKKVHLNKIITNYSEYIDDKSRDLLNSFYIYKTNMSSSPLAPLVSVSGYSGKVLRIGCAHDPFKKSKKK